MLSICVQAIPIPHAKASAVRSIFNLAAKRLGFEFQIIKGRLSFFTCIKVEFGSFLMPDFLFALPVSPLPSHPEHFDVVFVRKLSIGVGAKMVAERYDFISSSRVLACCLVT